MPENLQVADGPEPARARGMRQNLVYLSILSQHHANEVQSIESPEEGARLLRFNPTSDCRRNDSLVRFAIVSICVKYRFSMNERSSTVLHLFPVQHCERLKVTLVFKLSAFHNCNVKNGSRDVRCFVPRKIYEISYVTPFPICKTSLLLIQIRNVN